MADFGCRAPLQVAKIVRLALTIRGLAMRSVCAAVVCVFAAMCLACGGAGAPSTARRVTEPKSDVLEVAADFAADSGAATKVYRGRELEVVGEVKDSGRADRNSSGPHLLLTVSAEVSVMCCWTRRTADEGDAVLELRKGERVTVRGKVLNAIAFEKEKHVQIVLDDCALVK